MNGLSVLICTANRPAWLHALLRSIADDPTRPADLQLVVVDNSRDASAALLASDWPFPITHLHLAEPSIASARNLALAAAATDLALLLDDDQLVPPDFFAALARAWLGRPAWASGLRLGVLPAPEPDADPRFFAAPATRLPIGHPVTRREFATNGLLLTRPAFAALGMAPFDPYFGLTGGEDTEFFVRLSRLGFRFAFRPDVTVIERIAAPRATLWHLLRTGFRTGMTDAMIARRSEGKTTLEYATDALQQLTYGVVFASTSTALGQSPKPTDLMQVTRFFGKAFALCGGRWEPYRPSRRRRS